jgi:hypothetical protein
MTDKITYDSVIIGLETVCAAASIIFAAINLALFICTLGFGANFAIAAGLCALQLAASVTSLAFRGAKLDKDIKVKNDINNLRNHCTQIPDINTYFLTHSIDTVKSDINFMSNSVNIPDVITRAEQYIPKVTDQLKNQLTTLFNNIVNINYTYSKNQEKIDTIKDSNIEFFDTMSQISSELSGEADNQTYIRISQASQLISGLIGVIGGLGLSELINSVAVVSTMQSFVAAVTEKVQTLTENLIAEIRQVNDIVSNGLRPAQGITQNVYSLANRCADETFAASVQASHVQDAATAQLKGAMQAVKEGEVVEKGIAGATAPHIPGVVVAVVAAITILVSLIDIFMTQLY